MKADIHPTWFAEATVTCACGNTWSTGSTRETIRTDVCSNCHPFYTGEQRIVDTEGQVDRFLKRLRAREEYSTQQEVEEAGPDLGVAITELDLGSRYESALEKEGLTTIGDLLAKLEDGDTAITDIKGIGAKTLVDMKKAMRGLGYTLPDAE